MKKKGSIGGNPNPVQTPEFLAKQFPPAPDVSPGIKLGEPVCVSLPLPIDQEVRKLENRSVWLRRVIVAAAQQELMGDTPQHGLEETAAEPGDVAAAKPKRVRKPKEKINE